MKTKKPSRATDELRPIVRRFRVYVEQVNQTYVDVTARCASEAEDKAYAKWRREYAHSRVSYVKELPNDKAETRETQ